MRALELVELTELMEITIGRPEIVIGLIDGTVAVDHPDLAGKNIHEIRASPRGERAQTSSAACMHGTFIAGIMFGTRGGVAPALCPGCTLLVCPIFGDAAPEDEQVSSATPEDLAAAILETVDAGARVLNLSVAIAQPSARGQRALENALDHAMRRDVLVVAAAGNQGTLGSSAIIRHPWVIPVVACDLHGIPILQSNLGRTLGQRGLRAPGDRITSIGANGRALTLAGTSVATPFVTGTAALLWSAFPGATAAEVKRAVLQAHLPRQATVVPPLLDARAAYRAMADIRFTRRNMSMKQQEQPSSLPAEVPGAQMPEQPPASRRVMPQASTGECGCRERSAPATPPSYVFALGRIGFRFPGMAVEKELAQAMGRVDTSGLTDQQAVHAVLSQRQNRYLVRQLCWVLAIEGIDTYLLYPRDPADLDLLMESMRREPSAMDLDVVIGARGPVAGPEACNGLMVPMVALDQIYSFDRDSLIRAIPRPASVPEDQEARFRAASSELFDKIKQLADNAGATDEHRALNYLVVRYPAIYAAAAEAYGRSSSLTAVEARLSRLSGTRKIVDVVFSFTRRGTDVTEKSFVRVDVTETFPFLVTGISPYFDR